MIYPHQQKAIEYIAEKFQKEEQVLALLLSGSIAHGFNDEHSDVDINIVVTDERYARQAEMQRITYYEDASQFYPDGYFDGKFITLGILRDVAERGNEPTRFALHDARILFDRTGQVAQLQSALAVYDEAGAQERAVRFLSQMEGWKWYCEEGIRRQNRYLQETSAAKMILFAGRLVLLDNRVFFPSYKWFLRVLEAVPNKPEGLMAAIDRVLQAKTAENLDGLFDLVKGYRDWSGGQEYSWTSHFVRDAETVWMRQEEYIDNL